MVTAQNVSQASPIEKWAFFLLNAETLTLDEIRLLFPEIEFSEAAGVLDMISKNPEQRQQYEARLKFQRDEAARLEGALTEGMQEGIKQGRVEGRLEGLHEGLEKGQLIGQITLLQDLLSIYQPSPEELLSLNDVQLTELIEQLKRQLRSRGQ